MSSPVLETDAFPASVTAPDINDQTYPGVVRTLTTSLASRTRYHENTLTGLDGDDGTETFEPDDGAVFLGNLTVPTSGRADLLRNAILTLNNKFTWIRQLVTGAGLSTTTVHWLPGLNGGSSSEWSADTTNTAVFVPTINQKTAGVNYASLTMPHVMPGLLFGTLTATVRSATSHGGSLPLSMPRIALVSTDSTGTAAEVAGATDASANTTAFEAMHTISCPINALVAPTLGYSIALRGEGSSNAQSNSFKLYRLSLTITHT